MATTRQFYQVFSIGVGPSPATGYHFQTGFNNIYTGANSGQNLIQTLERMQSVTHGFSQDRQTISQLGQLGPVGREITTPPTVDFGGSYYVADLSNERILGFYVSGNQGSLANILNKNQSEKNYFLSIAPQGSDNIGYTGEKQAFLISNGTLASWSTEGSVGNIPTTNFSVQGFNMATYTGSKNQTLLAINPTDGSYVNGILFTLPTATSGINNTVAALRPNDISVSISNAAIGLDISDLKAQSYNISFDLNLQALNKLGSIYPYAREPQFPVTLSASTSFYYGDLVTGSLKDLICNDGSYTLRIAVNDPCGGGEAVVYECRGMKIDAQAFDSQDVGSVASIVNLNYSTLIGSSTDSVNNLLISGRNVST